MADETYQPKVYKTSNGDKLVLASGGEIKVETGGKITANGTLASHIADATTNHNLNSTYSDTEVEAALNASQSLFKQVQILTVCNEENIKYYENLMSQSLFKQVQILTLEEAKQELQKEFI